MQLFNSVRAKINIKIQKNAQCIGKISGEIPQASRTSLSLKMVTDHGYEYLIECLLHFFNNFDAKVCINAVPTSDKMNNYLICESLAYKIIIHFVGSRTDIMIKYDGCRMMIYD